MAGSASIRVLFLLVVSAYARAQSIPVSFSHGVASGDPLPNAIILWTRVTPREVNATKLASLAIPIKWIVSTTPTFSQIAATGEFTTTADRDFTVKVDATGLTPGKRYYYVFLAASGAIRSPVGRFHLFPTAGATVDRLRYAIFSCSNWGYGYFNAYDAASRYDLDFWMHLGDWIYEYGIDTYPSPSEAVRYQPAPLGLQPPTELLSLSDYRIRHALYRQDPGLQALSAAAPVIAAWDDHEIANNGWTGGAENHQPNEGSWAARKAAAIQAYHEWMPTRPKPADPVAFYRSFQFGNLATLLMLETRYSARTDPSAGAVLDDTFNSVAKLGFAAYPPSQWTSQLDAAGIAFAAEGDALRNDPNRNILGPQQLQWIRQTTQASLSSTTTWQLYGQDTVMQDQYPPDLEKAIANEPAGARKQLWQSAFTNLTDAVDSHTTTIYTKMPRWSYLRGLVIPVATAMKYAIRTVVALGRFRINFNYDSWSGYIAERKRFLNAVSGGASDAGKLSKLNSVVYGGDSHNAWAGVLRDANNSVVAVEFDGAAVTSPGFEDFFPFMPLDLLAAGVRAANPNMAYANVEDKGFMLATLTHKSHRVDMMKLDNIGSMDYKLLCDASFRVLAGSKKVKRVKCSPLPPGDPYASVIKLDGGLASSFSALP